MRRTKKLFRKRRRKTNKNKLHKKNVNSRRKRPTSLRKLGGSPDDILNRIGKCMPWFKNCTAATKNPESVAEASPAHRGQHPTSLAAARKSRSSLSAATTPRPVENKSRRVFVKTLSNNSISVQDKSPHLPRPRSRRRGSPPRGATGEMSKKLADWKS